MNYLSNAAFQLAVVTVLASLFWLGHVLIAKVRKRPFEPWTRWLGVHPAPRWTRRMWIFPVAALSAAALVLLQGLVIEDFRAFLGKTSAGEIVAAPAPERLIGLFVYPLVTSALCEELLFRGLIAKWLIRRLGFGWGNALQTALFLAPHLLLVHFFAESSHAALYASAGLTIAPMAWLAGWAMHRFDEGSIFTPWLIHAGLNFGNGLAVWLYLS